MSLTTTMGIELTYVPLALQIAIDRGATFEPRECSPGEDGLLNGFRQLMRHMVMVKKIPVWRDPSTDPGCVEIQTKPYKKLTTLINVARRLRREAEALGMATNASYTGGGGAHIHTGIIGSTKAERDMYAKRMNLFVAMNPWICWATLNVVDDINAKPLVRHHLTPHKHKHQIDTEPRLLEAVKLSVKHIARMERQAHIEEYWTTAYYRREYERDRQRARRELHGYKKGLLEIRKTKALIASMGTNEVPVSTIECLHSKDHMLRITSYGTHGTMEFRCFEMGDEAKLRRNIILANAICKYCEKWEIETYNPNDVMSGEQMQKIKWSEARAGWLGMLDKLGLDAKDFRFETAQIALRWRYSRSEKVNPTAADISREAEIEDDNAGQQARTFAREARRAAERIARTRARWERRQERGGRRPMYGPSATLDGVPVTCSLFAGPVLAVDEAAWMGVDLAA
jgi:hypothetical protein